MRFKVLDARRSSDHAVWLERWHAWPRREIMAHPEYALRFARSCDRAVCVLGEGATGSAVLLPLLLRPLSQEAWARPGESRWDATTPYGYGGPFMIGDAGADPRAFWKEYAGWCREAQVVATFMRLALFPDELAPLPWTVEARLPNIVVSLRGGMDAVRGEYDENLRRCIKRARAAGVEVEVDASGRYLDDFVAVYTHTMVRRGAERFYFFPRTFFEQLFARMPGYCFLFHARIHGNVVSSDLVLCSQRRAYYFLGGTFAASYPLHPNHLLKDWVAAWLADQGKDEYVLGGGYQPGDGVFQYKRSFARHGEVPFKVAHAVHDARAYAELVRDRWEYLDRHGQTQPSRPGYYPAYRG